MPECKDCDSYACDECGHCKCEENKWISVKDKLPEEDEEGYSVTVLISDGKNISIGYYEFEYFAKDDEDPCLYSSDCWHDDGIAITKCNGGYGEVTHWMPLPLLPNKIQIIADNPKDQEIANQYIKVLNYIERNK